MGELQDFIPLARATALAHDELFAPDDVKASKALDVIALALSALIPFYHRDENSGLRALSEAELATGRFTRGATTLEFAHKPPLGSLVVSRAELDRAIVALREDALIAGRLSLMRRQLRQVRA